MKGEELNSFINMSELGQLCDFNMTNDKFFVWSRKQVYTGSMMVSREAERSVVYVEKLRFEIEATSEDYIAYITSKGNDHLP